MQGCIMTASKWNLPKYYEWEDTLYMLEAISWMPGHSRVRSFNPAEDRIVDEAPSTLFYLWAEGEHISEEEFKRRCAEQSAACTKKTPAWERINWK